MDVIARQSRTAATTRTLGAINLTFLCLSIGALAAAFPGRARYWLVPVPLLNPIVPPMYQSADSIAIHGALALCATAIAIQIPNTRSLGVAALMGLLLFAVHKVRSTYGLCAIAATLLASAAPLASATSRRLVLRSMLVVAAAFAALEIPWKIAVTARAEDPRIVERDSLGAHNFWEPLVSGIGWTENPREDQAL